MEMYTKAVKDSASHFTLSYSPGGGNEPADGEWASKTIYCPPSNREWLLENTDGVGAPQTVFSRGGSLLPSIYADVRACIDDAIGFYRPRQTKSGPCTG